MKGQNVLFSHKSDNYITPKWLIDDLKKEFDIQLDVCTTRDNPLNIPKFFWYPEWDGLNGCSDWETYSYCNPPYSQVGAWVHNAWCQYMYRGIKSILLLPARTDTKWFHEYIYKKPYTEIRFLKGRLKFEGTKYSAPFPSMLVIFG
jgi:phage N-6-adenine-methyltransferase